MQTDNLLTLCRRLFFFFVSMLKHKSRKVKSHSTTYTWRTRHWFKNRAKKVWKVTWVEPFRDVSVTLHCRLLFCYSTLSLLNRLRLENTSNVKSASGTSQCHYAALWFIDVQAWIEFLKSFFFFLKKGQGNSYSVAFVVLCLSRFDFVIYKAIRGQ